MSNKVDLTSFNLSDIKVDKSPIISDLENVFGRYPNGYTPKPNAKTLEELLELLHAASKDKLKLSLPKAPTREFRRRWAGDITAQCYARADAIALFSMAFSKVDAQSEVIRLAGKLDSITLTKSLLAFTE